MSLWKKVSLAAALAAAGGSALVLSWEDMTPARQRGYERREMIYLAETGDGSRVTETVCLRFRSVVPCWYASEDSKLLGLCDVGQEVSIEQRRVIHPGSEPSKLPEGSAVIAPSVEQVDCGSQAQPVLKSDGDDTVLAGSLRCTRSHPMTNAPMTTRYIGRAAAEWSCICLEAPCVQCPSRVLSGRDDCEQRLRRVNPSVADRWGERAL